MSITVGKLFENAAVQYQMKLLAGQKGLNNLVEWVHIIENDDVSKFLHGNEVVFTSGILNNTEGWLLDYAKKLHSVGTSAFVVNVGPYTKSIPNEVIDYCNLINMPLYRMPWETKMVDVTRDICYRIMNRQQVEINISKTIKDIIFRAGDLETLTLQMERHGYSRDSKFCFIVMSFENKKDNNQEININAIKNYSERIARNINELYISFSYNDSRVLALVNYSNYDINEFISKFMENWSSYPWKIYMGVSQNKSGIKMQYDNFRNALLAMEMAKKQNKEAIFYEELDIYKLLLNTKDKTVLQEYYNDTLGKIENYDKENNTDLMAFLHMYLKNNGSQSLVAEKQYIHRNTVNNQVKKIEKIMGYSSLNLDEKLKLYLAFFIKDIL